ncbi:MAG: division/cell wall cluster transcriptional repressor MraZ [Oscillospiraceae bacterium]|jgi:MraZ protein|nr:division/cell wall cluster transcriptional repressor MraZ [Oscillospiraceae bacterium]
MAEDFVGTFDHSLDNKGRTIVPSAFREQLGTGFTAAMNSEWKALALYPSQKWNCIRERLSRMRDTDPAAMAYKRMVSAYAMHVDELDSQGRVLLPKVMREKAGLGQRILFIGMGDYVEVWDAARYAQHESASLARMDELIAYVDERYNACSRTNEGGI